MTVPLPAGSVSPPPDGAEPAISVRGLTMAYGDFVLQHDLTFDVQRGDIFAVMGGSGCGKSTLMRHLVGLQEPARGSVWYGRQDFTNAGPDERNRLLRRLGVLYQGGALWSSMTLAENVGLPLDEFTDLAPEEIREVTSVKLALVGLSGFDDYFPSDISGGMRKRAGLARAMALDPAILVIDEPSAGLDPISSRLLDRLIVELRDSLETTVVMVTHELDSIFSIATNSIFLDAETRTMTAAGPPTDLRDHCDDPTVRRFLHRGVDDE